MLVVEDIYAGYGLRRGAGRNFAEGEGGIGRRR